MSNLKKMKPSRPSRAAWITGVACITCCTIPFIGIAMGSATLAAFTLYSEGVAIAIAALGATWFTYKYISRKKAPACRLDGSCRPTADKGNKPQAD